MKKNKKEKVYVCPLELTVGVIGGKWKILIIHFLLAEGATRFGELKKVFPKITQQTLTTQLRELEDDGIIKRKLFPGVPPKVEYSLTTYGKTLAPILKLMMKWGVENEKITKRPFQDINCTIT